MDGFERRGKKARDGSPDVLRFPSDEIRENVELQPALLEQFAHEILAMYRSDPECTQEKIEDSKKAFRLNLKADYGKILSTAYKNRLLLHDLRLYHCAVAALYIEERENERKNDGSDLVKI